MKIARRIGIAIMSLLVCSLIFRASIYRKAFKYESAGQRKPYSVTDEKLADVISRETHTANPPNACVSEIVSQSLATTSAHLNFTAAKNETDPNKLINTKTAHCVGYAAFFSTVCNRKFETAGLKDWSAKPQIGHLCLFGENIHRYFHSPFFKDHDFVIVENRKTRQKIAVDPTLHDYLLIDSVSLKAE